MVILRSKKNVAYRPENTVDDKIFGSDDNSIETVQHDSTR